MAVVVVVTFDGAGNFPPERAVVRELAGRGHQVHVLGFASQADAVHADGAIFHNVEGVVQPRSTDRHANRDRPWAIRNILFAPGYGESLAKAIEQLLPDLILVDFFLATALSSGVASSIPTVALGHTIYSFICSQFREPPLWPVVEACALVHIFSYRHLDPAESIPERVRFYAPYHGKVRSKASLRQRPSIVVSLSTSFQGQGALIQKLCDATASLEASVLVTIGGAFEASEFDSGDNTTITRFAEHDQILPGTDLLITHAGHGTVMAGARHGVPMLCIPMGRDQPYVAAQAERVGLCKVLSPDISVDRLRDAIVSALRDEAMRKRSAAFASSVADAPDVVAAANELETLID